jgi:dienelactone hydrolase
LRAQLAALGDPVIVSPWPGEGMPHASEQEAAAAFHRGDGLAGFEARIAAAAGEAPCVLVGFSVGATATWRYLASPSCNTGCVAFLYYGSRIRDCPALVPRCVASLVFAEHEASFDPAALAAIVDRTGASATVLPGTRHGFMNPASAHYRPDIADAQFRSILDSVRARQRVR